MRNKTFIIILVSTLILSIPAILNGHPFMFNDSIEYLSSNRVIFRSPIYTIFGNLGINFGTTWAVLIAQTFLTSICLYIFAKYFIKEYTSSKFLVIIGLLTAFSSLPNFTGFIMADIFTPLSFIIVYIFAFKAKELSKLESLFLMALGIFCFTAHVANIIINIGFILFLGIAKFFSKNIIIRTPVLLTSFSALLLIFINGAYFNSYSISPSGSVFMMANLSQDGLVQKYLKNNCSEKKYEFCNYIEDIPLSSDAFLWTADSALYKMNGFAGAYPEAKIIVKETIKNYPIEFGLMAYNRFSAALKTHTPYMEIKRWTVFPEVRERYKNRFGEKAHANLMNSLQMRDKMPIEAFKILNNIVMTLSLGLIFIFLFYYTFKFNPKALVLVGSFVVFTLINTFICSVTSGVFDRYQARVTWLLVLAAIMIVNNKKELA